MTLAADKMVHPNPSGDESRSPSPRLPRIVGIPKEIYPQECRVAATPDTAQALQKLGFIVVIEHDAGAAASFPDAAYQAVGCEIAPDATTLWQQADIVLKVRPPEPSEAPQMRSGQTLISFLYPAQNSDLLQTLAQQQITAIAMDAVPRISRAQKLDALSSMANIAGYRAVIEAAHHFGRFFTGQITAAGKVPPAKVMIIGAGVAGLAAIGTARGLGAIVRAFDTRLVVKEQVESLGAEFLELNFAEDGSGEGGYAKVMSDEFIKAEMELFAQQAKEVDIIITTALIPGKRAPVLITQEMVESMKQGSVIVDMAAEQGGNCEVTQSGEVVTHHGVHVIGFTDLPSRMAAQSSQLYGKNLVYLLSDMGGSEKYQVNYDDEVVRGALVLHDGTLTWPAPKPAAPPPAPTPAPAPTPPVAAAKSESKSSLGWLWLSLAIAALLGLGLNAPPSFLSHFTVFVLAIFVGWQIIWNVTPALHTPLMSVTNAISGIIIIGGILQISGPLNSPTTILGAIALFLGTINICGGFLVTQRMLKMFQK